MTGLECNEKWKTVIRIYKETQEQTNNPKDTAQAIVKELGKDDTLAIFSTVAKMKEHDGRIYGKNREFISSIPFVDECVWSENGHDRTPPKVWLRGLDDIHPTHINQIIGQLRQM